MFFKWEDQYYQVKKCYHMYFISVFFKRMWWWRFQTVPLLQDLSYSQVLGEGGWEVLNYVLLSDWGVGKKVPCLFMCQYILLRCVRFYLISYIDRSNCWRCLLAKSFNGSCHIIIQTCWLKYLYFKICGMLGRNWIFRKISNVS